MTSTNNNIEWELIGKGLIELQTRLSPFIKNKMTQCYGENWLKSNDMSRVIQRKAHQIEYNLNNLDLAMLLDIIDENIIWQRVFQAEFQRNHRSEIIRLKDIRNRHAHPSVDNQFTLDEVDQAFSSMLVLLTIIEPNENQMIRALKQKVLWLRWSEIIDVNKIIFIGLPLLTILASVVAAIWSGNKYVLADKEKLPENPSQQPIITKPNTQQHTLQAKSLKIGILGDPNNYNGLADYLRSRFGNQVQVVVDGDRSISYSEARNRLVNQEWDIAFTLSPMLSVAARDNGYTFAAQMFPNNSPYYQSALFVKSDSSIKSLNDLKPATTIALGDFNSASSFYMPAYDLFGKTLQVDMGHRSKKILEMVKTGKADVGSVVLSNVENKDNFRIIHLSRQIPGSNVYLSSKLSQSDRETLKKVLLEAPESVRKQANYGAGIEQDYSTFVQISRKAEEVLKCANFQKNPVNFYCPNSNISKNIPPKNNTSTISGRINGWSRKSDNIEKFTLSGNDNKTYHLVISRQILNQIPGVSNPLSLQNQKVTIIGVQPRDIGKKILELQINNPNLISISKTSDNSSNNK